MSYAAQVIADSVGPHGVRITTVVATFPRFILAEFNTHRMFSRNSASSRALPPEDRVIDGVTVKGTISRVRDNPFVPEVFRQRVKGMGQGDALDSVAQERARQVWLAASIDACEHAEQLARSNVSKAHVNRILEPYLWHTALVTATHWSNFFALRQPQGDDPVPDYDHGAQPEMQIVARMMRDAMRASEPDHLDYGDWHLPFVDADERASEEIPIVDGERVGGDHDYWPNVSAGRCFVISYDKLAKISDEPHLKGFERSERGRGVGHWSPLEHPAFCSRPVNGHAFGITGDDWHANYLGWTQLRKLYPHESNFQELVDEAGVRG